MPKLKKSDFAHRADIVAKNLLGRRLVIRQPNDELIKARLTEIAAYEGMEKRTSEGVLYSSGLVSISTKFSQKLLDIATGKQNQPSCITLRGIDLELEDRIESIQGPGNVTRALGIDKSNQDNYESFPAYRNKLWITGNSIEKSKIRTLKGNSPNCIGIYKI